MTESTDADSAPDNRQGNATNEDGNDTTATTRSKRRISLAEILYSASSYHTIAKPVSLTMILSALTVLYIRTPASRKMGESEMNGIYTVFDTSGDAGKSTATALGLSLVNALIIVCFITFMTFVIVILYKFRCMKLLSGYMIISSAALLGLEGNLILRVAVERYSIPIDKLSFYFTLYNFAAVGVIAIFYQKGIPSFITQGYLVAISVILAWQLSHFNDWTAWTLLFLLAVYDLCAVLTPCGPLRLLVNLMQRDDAPIIPGLLYEAPLPAIVVRPDCHARFIDDHNRNSENREINSNANSHATGNKRLSRQSIESNSEGIEMMHYRMNKSENRSVKRSSDRRRQQHKSDSNSFRSMQEHTQSTREQNAELLNDGTTVSESINGTGEVQIEASFSSDHNSRPISPLSSLRENQSQQRNPRMLPSSSTFVPDNSAHQSQETPHRLSSDDTNLTGEIPLAIAKIYRLDILSPTEIARRMITPLENGADNTNSDVANSGSPSVLLAETFTQGELVSNVLVRFPRNGGYISVYDPEEERQEDSGFFNRNRIRRRPQNQFSKRYIVSNRHGIVKRVLLVDEEGKVFEEVHSNSREGEDDTGRNSIKLGLGDFIFYSVLVSKSALYSFTTFAACMLVILGGLGGTLVLLSVFDQALPALPISIFLGVIFYLLTRLLIEPWVEEVMKSPFYV